MFFMTEIETLGYFVTFFSYFIYFIFCLASEGLTSSPHAYTIFIFKKLKTIAYNSIAYRLPTQFAEVNIF